MHITFDFKDCNLFVKSDDWEHLVSGGSSPAFSSISAAVVGFLRDGGAVMIDKEGVGIMKRMDSVRQFEEYLDAINDERKHKNLEPLKL